MLKKWIITSCALVAVGANAAPNVVTTIKPLQSLVAQIMDGVAEPTLLIEQGSPHGYQLKPSDVRKVANADIVVYVDDGMETFLPKLLEKTAADKQQSVIRWSKVPGIEMLKTRHGGLWPEHHHDHGDHDDHDHADHDHADHDHADHDHADHDHADHDHADHDHEGMEAHHHHGEYNPHLWLSIENAEALSKAVAAKLESADPANAEKYKKNLQTTLAALNTLDEQLDKQLAPVKGKPFMVFHDAYQYFEHDHGLHAVGAIRVSPEHEPGAQRIGEIRQLLKSQQAACLFAEPQFPSKMVAKLVDGTGVHQGVLDPIGADIPAGKALYGKLLSNLSQNLVNCLSR